MGAFSVSSAAHTDARKAVKSVKCIIIAFNWGGYYEADQPNWVARCLDLGIADSALIQPIL